MTAQTTPRRKSIRLTPDELKALKAYRKHFNTEVECAEAIDIKRETLGRVFLVGSGSPVTVGKIRLAISMEEP